MRQGVVLLVLLGMMLEEQGRRQGVSSGSEFCEAGRESKVWNSDQQLFSRISVATNDG